jgi:nucleotide-binding universal stress UspA family protein
VFFPLPPTNPPHAEKILPVASRMAHALGMQLRLVQVLNPDLVPAGGVAQESNYLRHLAAGRTFSATNERVDFDVLHGAHPEDAIIDYIEAFPDVALLAMATRGVPPRSRMVHPSVTYRVLRRVVCPIVVLHPPDLS